CGLRVKRVGPRTLARIPSSTGEVAFSTLRNFDSLPVWEIAEHDGAGNVS
ncbi:hypothetical protein A2U01_0073802, partial [Trifolium medium]|nr:hypothetical protein [Trifolium medium]